MVYKLIIKIKKLLYSNIHTIFIISLFKTNILIFFLLIKKRRNFYLKDVDKFSFEFIKISYKNIAYYLNNKYIRYFDNIKDNKRTNKKRIRIYAVGRKKYMKRVFKRLKNDFIFEFTNNNPDYLIYDIKNCYFLSKKYENSIKIAFFSENVLPDFNKADYSIGFHNLNYLDRYFRKTSLIYVFEKRFISLKINELIKIRKKMINKKKKKFCAAVISNFHKRKTFRNIFIKELKKYKNVDLAGKHNQNIGKGSHNKIKFLSSYKFSIAMENSEGEGYISEKILDSFLAGNIPIYYGGYDLNQYFNNKAFILIRGEKDMIKKIDYIKEIDNNEQLYNNILKENIFVNDNYVLNNRKEMIQFFKHIFEQDKKMARRVDNYNWKIKDFI